jgi:hypothetical protein
MLKNYKDKHKQFNTIINTFGFGYSIDTTLLLNLAVEGHGVHSFVPDASFVGTAFVNSLSNLLVFAHHILHLARCSDNIM